MTWAGREATEDRDEVGQLFVTRKLFVGNRLYKFRITGGPDRPTAEELATFFDSFVPQKSE